MSKLSYLYQHKKWIAIFFVILLFALGASLYANDHNGKVNIGRADYRQALDKWHSSNVKHYRIRVNKYCGGGYCGIVDFEVDGSDKKVGFMQFWGDPITHNPPVYESIAEEYTVDALFAEVDRILSDDTRQSFGAAIDYTIDFDPVYGYPRLISSKGRESQVETYGSAVWHIGDKWTVEDFDVLP